MNLENNKQVARDVITALTNGDYAAADKLMTDDATWWLLPSIGRLEKKAELFARLPHVWAHLAEPLDVKFLDFTVEDDRVSLTFTARAKHKNGKLFDNHYHVLMTFRDGKLAAAKEWFDTAHAFEVFGPH